jgi:hypothetical protein
MSNELTSVFLAHLNKTKAIDVLPPEGRLGIYVFSIDDACDDVMYRGFIVHADTHTQAIEILSNHLMDNHTTAIDVLTFLGILETELNWTVDLIGFTATWNKTPSVYMTF